MHVNIHARSRPRMLIASLRVLVFLEADRENPARESNLPKSAILHPPRLSLSLVPSHLPIRSRNPQSLKVDTTCDLTARRRSRSQREDTGRGIDIAPARVGGGGESSSGTSGRRRRDEEQEEGVGAAHQTGGGNAAASWTQRQAGTNPAVPVRRACPSRERCGVRARARARQPAKIAGASSLRLAPSQQAILGHTRAHDYL